MAFHALIRANKNQKKMYIKILGRKKLFFQLNKNFKHNLIIKTVKKSYSARFDDAVSINYVLKML